MPLDAKLVQHLQKTLTVVDDHGASSTRLLDEARRLWNRVRRFTGITPINPAKLDTEAMELACYALQFPQRRSRSVPVGRAARPSARERSEEAIEMLIRAAGKEASEELLERTARVLREMHQRPPGIDEAKLLTDAVSLDDFGVVGLLRLAVQTARKGGSVTEIADGIEKRIQYGYWEARLKDGFYFESTQSFARRRLANARKAAELLQAEMDEDAT
ncbi:MAG TPA: hypothetical protein VG326_08120 [Tepidisphaeraceae bacterium]|nr:hypothetical protein [Tepidisphaeraceae bacterium]